MSLYVILLDGINKHIFEFWVLSLMAPISGKSWNMRFLQCELDICGDYAFGNFNCTCAICVIFRFTSRSKSRLFQDPEWRLPCVLYSAVKISGLWNCLTIILLLRFENNIIEYSAVLRLYRCELHDIALCYLKYIFPTLAARPAWVVAILAYCSMGMLCLNGVTTPSR